VVTLNAEVCTFRIYLPNAGSVELLGTFNEWKAGLGSSLELRPDDRGWWAVQVPLEGGEHEFCYLVDGITWMPDYAAGGIRRNGDGRWISLLSVPVETVLLERKPMLDEEALPVGMDAGVGRMTVDEPRSSARRRAFSGL